MATSTFYFDLDAVLNQAAPTTNTGGSGSLGIAGQGGTGTAQFLIMGISALTLPPTTINNVTFEIVENTPNASPREYDIYSVLAANNDWVENSTTWNTKDGTNAWVGGANGGGVASSDIAPQPIGHLAYPGSIVAAPTDIVYRCAIDNAPVAAAANSRFSILLKRQGNSTSASPSFRMSETGTPSSRARLIVNHTPTSTYEVGPTPFHANGDTGNDTTGDGSWSNPYKTIKKFCENITRANRGYLRGVFQATNSNPDMRLIPGTSEIIISSLPGEYATILGTLYIANANYVTFQDFEVTWNADEFPVGTTSWVHMMKMRGGLAWTLRRIKARDSIAHSNLCIDYSPSNTGTLPGDLWTIDDCDLFGTLRPSYSTNNQDHNLYIATRAPTQAYVERNRIWNTRNGQNVKVGSDTEDTGNITFRYNSIYDANGTDVKNISLSHKCLGCTIEYNIFHSPIPTNYNVEQTSKNGVLGVDYGNHIVRNNIGYGGVGVAEVTTGLVDGGGNQVFDPGFIDPASGVFLLNSAGPNYAAARVRGTFAPRARQLAVGRNTRV